MKPLKIFRSALFLIVLFTAPLTEICGQGQYLREYEAPEFLQQPCPWADSIISEMDLDQKISQLFMVATWSNKDEEHFNAIEQLIKDEQIGGLIFFQGGPERQATLTDRFQSISKIPLMLGMDAEWGLAMRLDSTLSYPKQMTLGAISNDTLIYKMGLDIAEQMKALGVHVNFAPVADVNNNPDNPVINYRSFGENVQKVSVKSYAYAKGLQDAGVLANAKHFPGHGDTNTDSHKDLPIIEHSRSRLDSIELKPFKYLISRGIGSIMVAHLYIPSLDDSKNTASTLSKFVVDSILKKELGFDGLIFTDALNMKGVSKFFEPGETDEKALSAGNDILLFSLSVSKAKEKIKASLKNGSISEEDITDRCHKVLKAKEWLGLTKYEKDTITDLKKVLDSPYSNSLIERLYTESVTLLKNENSIIPLPKYSTRDKALVIVGDYLDNPYHIEVRNRTLKHTIAVPKDLKIDKINATLEKLKDIDDVIVNIHGMSQRPNRYFGIEKQTVQLVDSLRKHHRVVLNVFGNPYALIKYPELLECDAVFVLYEDVPYSQKAAAKALLGDVNIKGRLPVTINSDLPEGTGIMIEHNKMTYGFPEEVGISSNILSKIDSIVTDGIEKQAYPGCVVLVAKNEKIIYHKSFGHTTYENKRAIKPDDIYDLASITKIAATAAGVMRLVEEGKLDINKTLGHYLPSIPDSSFMHDAVIKNVLTHQAGFRSWIPFYVGSMKDGKLRSDLYRKKRSNKYSVQVSENLFITESYKDSIFYKIVGSEPRSTNDYKYSDLGFYLLPMVIEKLSGQKLEEFVSQEFYAPMGIETLTFKPLQLFPKDRIVPTEHDLYFRNELLQGYVHDPGAAMLGGVSGHAGLFGNAYDLAVYMQMLTNGGLYNHKRFIEPKTIEEFTKCQFCLGTKDDNRRALIFDKPAPEGQEGPTCECVSYLSFGHSGFTGTLAWADPEEDLVYIFLSNRIYPSAKNKKLISMNIRTEIMQVIYDSILEKKAFSEHH
ncbi:MAG: serine hydrolase [Flavobacteriales bacterium]|nr:serine hydrolase [Flavobacteriales bacterium]